jgi:hypothetical protein
VGSQYLPLNLGVRENLRGLTVRRDSTRDPSGNASGMALINSVPDDFPIE